MSLDSQSSGNTEMYNQVFHLQVFGSKGKAYCTCDHICAQILHVCTSQAHGTFHDTSMDSNEEGRAVIEWQSSVHNVFWGDVASIEQTTS